MCGHAKVKTSAKLARKTYARHSSSCEGQQDPPHVEHACNKFKASGRACQLLTYTCTHRNKDELNEGNTQAFRTCGNPMPCSVDTSDDGSAAYLLVLCGWLPTAVLCLTPLGDEIMQRTISETRPRNSNRRPFQIANVATRGEGKKTTYKLGCGKRVQLKARMTATPWSSECTSLAMQLHTQVHVARIEHQNEAKANSIRFMTQLHRLNTYLRIRRHSTNITRTCETSVGRSNKPSIPE